jgi:hypothetical protein
MSSKKVILIPQIVIDTISCLMYKGGVVNKTKGMRMNTQQLITQMTERMAADIAFVMQEWGYTYAQAREYVAAKSTAGAGVWRILDNQFTQQGGQA